MPKKYLKKTKKHPVYKLGRRLAWREDNTTRVKLHSLTGLQIANDSTAEQRTALLFQLANCNYFSRFTAMYDQYRIDQVVVTFRPTMSTAVNRPFDDTTVPALGGASPRFVTAIDFDDTSTPVSVDELMSRHGSVTTVATKKQVRAFKPKRLIQVYRTAVSSGYMPDNSNLFLDCAQTDIPHYGLKYALDTSSPTRAFIYDIDIEYHLTFKGLRH